MAHERPPLRILRFPRRIAGYTDMGLPEFPPRPTGIVFVDRVGGAEFILVHNSDTDAVELQTPPPGRWRGVAFGAYSGPVLDSPAGLLRLFSSGSTLGYELAPEGWERRADQRILTWPRSQDTGGTGIVYELTAPAGWEFGDPLMVTRVQG